MVQHGAEHGIKRKLRMQKHRCFEEKIEFLQTCRRSARARNALNTAKNVLNRSVGRGESKNNFVGIFEAEANEIAVLQNAAINLFPVHEDAAAVAPVFEIPALTLGNDRGTLAGDAAVDKLQMVPSLTASQVERRFCEGNKGTRAVRGDNFKPGFVDGWQVRHGDTRCGDCSTPRLKITCRLFGRA